MLSVPTIPAPRIKGRTAAIVLAAGALALLCGCAGMKDALGISKHAPDEFAVVTKAPLIVPPDYNLLPPKPSVEQPRATNPQAEAIQALFPDHKVAPPSQSEALLIQQSGAAETSSNIRTKVGGESTEISDRGGDTTKILFDDAVTVPGQPEQPSIERRPPVAVEQVH
jgi:Protein of unknown function (DUF3035)